MQEVERMGLRVVKNTLKGDYDRGEERYVDVLGAVEIEITERCILQPDVINEIAELLAQEVASDCVERCFDITSWKLKRAGDTITVEPATVDVVEPDFGILRRDYEEAGDQIRRDMRGFLSLVILLVPSFLLWA